MKYCVHVRNRPKILVIVGPTASGKSALAVELARKFGGEIISADSRQVYKGLDVGTGKIMKREMKGVRHYLLDVASPKKNFNAGEFVHMAWKKIGDLIYQVKLPIVVGGTGFYIDALLGRIALPNVPPNPQLRARLKKKSARELFSMLQKKDPRRARAMRSLSERGNRVRLIRAIEISATIGRVPRTKDSPPSNYDTLWVGIRPVDAELARCIRIRLFARIRERGMIAEAKRLHSSGLSYRRMEELGLEYRSLARHLRGEISKEEMVRELERDIRKYAKKQLAYWKRNDDIQWFKPEEKRIVSTVRAWLRK